MSQKVPSYINSTNWSLYPIIEQFTLGTVQAKNCDEFLIFITK